MPQPQVFVSHSHQDDMFTERLVRDLGIGGAKVWVDVASITHGDFMKRIDEALAQCEWVVLVLTPAAIESEYVKREIYAALHRVAQGFMHDVIPVLAALCSPGTVPPQWDVLHRFDATANYTDAVRGLLRALGLPPEGVLTADSIAAHTGEFTPGDTGRSNNDRKFEQPTMPLPNAPPTGMFAEVSTSLLGPLFGPMGLAGAHGAAADMSGPTLPAFLDTSADRTDAAGMGGPRQMTREQWAANEIAEGRAKIAHGRAMLYEALTNFERATRLAPDNFDAWFYVGYTYNRLKRWQEGLAAWDTAIAIKPNDAIAWNNKGAALNGLERFAEALAANDRALALNPNLAAAWVGKGNALRGLKRTEEALAAYVHALALEPNNASALHAIRSVGQPKAVGPDSAVFWNLTGMELCSAVRYEEALVAYDRALSIFPRYGEVWKGKALLFRVLGREAEAQEAERRAKELGG